MAEIHPRIIIQKEGVFMVKRITEKMLQEYRRYLQQAEKSPATINKYMCDLKKLQDYAGKRKLTKVLVIEYKEHLRKSGRYKTSSINSFLVAANRLFEYCGWYELRIKTYKIQRETFVPESRELTKGEYKKLVQTAKKLGRERTALILQTICATGIRVSELSAITVEAARKGVATIYNKGKERKVLLSRALQVELLHYVRQKGIRHGAVFQTSSGKAVDRTSIWRDMKGLCEQAGVDQEKVFPHNLRHLFAQTFYRIDRDIARLADILGHSNIETTRIYLKESGHQYRKQLDHMRLLVGI